MVTAILLQLFTYTWLMTKEIDLTLFRRFLNNFSSVNDEEWNDFKTEITIHNFKRKQLFQEEGKQCKTVGFILKGCFRSIKIVDGEERTFDFAIENEFITDYYGILNSRPSEFNIVAVESSIVACIEAKFLFNLFDSSFTWQKMGRHIAEYVACYYQERLLSSYYDSPAVRYQKLMKSSPELFLRIPHNILANYLGMRKETLSRLRKKSSGPIC